MIQLFYDKGRNNEKGIKIEDTDYKTLDNKATRILWPPLYLHFKKQV